MASSARKGPLASISAPFRSLSASRGLRAMRTASGQPRKPIAARRRSRPRGTRDGALAVGGEPTVEGRRGSPDRQSRERRERKRNKYEAPLERHEDDRQ